MSRFIIIDAEQRSAEWRAARAGRLTGSRAQSILTKGKSGKESVMRRDYRLQLVAERIDGESQERLFFNADMQRGIDLEGAAFAEYEAQTGTMVMRTGFLQMVDVWAGCSLDGHIGKFSGITELKCPKMATHLAYWDNPESLLADHMAQVRHNLWVSGAAYCDLVSFHDRVPKKLQLLRKRIERYDADIAAYEIEALKFLGEVEDKLKDLEVYS